MKCEVCDSKEAKEYYDEGFQESFYLCKKCKKQIKNQPSVKIAKKGRE